MGSRLAAKQLRLLFEIVRQMLGDDVAVTSQEGRRLEATNARIADLEVRATAALEGGREDLAREAAQAIANLEADRDAAMTARTLFASEITRLKRHVASAEARITELWQVKPFIVFFPAVFLSITVLANSTRVTCACGPISSTS